MGIYRDKLSTPMVLTVHILFIIGLYRWLKKRLENLERFIYLLMFLYQILLHHSSTNLQIRQILKHCFIDYTVAEYPCFATRRIKIAIY